MIQKRAEELTELLKMRKEARENAEKITGYSARLEDLKTIVSDTAPLVKSCKVFRDNDIGDYQEKEILADATDYIHTLKKKFSENPDSIIQPGIFQQIKQSFDYLKMSLQNKLQTSWEQYIAKKTPVTNEELLSVLGRINAFRSTVLKVQGLNSQIENKKNTLPIEQSQVDDFLAMVEKLDETWQELGSDQVPEDVLSFLKSAVLPAGADLNLLTDEVKEWLNKNNINQSFRIRLNNY